MGKQGIEACADGASREEHIVHQHHMPRLHSESHVVDIGSERLLVGPEIVPEERHIQFPTVNLRAGKQFFQACLQPCRETRASRLEANQIGLGKIVVLDQLVGQPVENERKLRGRNQNLVLHVT